MKPPKTIVISMVTWKQLKKQWRKTLSGSPEKTEFFKLGVENFNFLNYEKFLAVFLLSIFELWMFSFLKYEISFLGSLFLKHKNIKNFFRVSVSWSIINLSQDWKVQGSISGNLRKNFFYENIRRALFWENIRFFFNI